jgi:hypothetical protein
VVLCSLTGPAIDPPRLITLLHLGALIEEILPDNLHEKKGHPVLKGCPIKSTDNPYLFYGNRNCPGLDGSAVRIATHPAEVVVLNNL